jgi:hypothetical protein
MDTLFQFLPTPPIAVIPVIAWVAVSALGLAGTAWFGAKSIDDVGEASEKIADASVKLGVLTLGGYLIYRKLKSRKGK